MITAVLSIIVILLDHLLKYYAETVLKAKGVYALLPGFLRLEYSQNTGMAFGLLGGHTALLALLTGAVCVCVVLAVKRLSLSRFTKAAFGLLLGGGIGNLLDRVFKGYVTDMFAFEFVNFAVFNVADMAVVLGVCCLCVSILFLPNEWEVKKHA